MKGIILAGGSGSRLYPLTLVTSKQLLPVYDKPMIYYPLSVLMLAGIQDILIISTPKDIPHFKQLLGNGHSFGLHLSYAVQTEPKGLAEAFLIGESFIDHQPVTMILGDNLFYGNGLSKLLKQAVQHSKQGIATIFGYYVHDPNRFGIVEFDQAQRVVSIEEKPVQPKSNYCVTGLYVYDDRVCDFVKQLRPSMRGELEITDLNNLYLQAEALQVRLLGRGFAWFDTGTMDSLLEASTFVQMIEKRQNIKISAPEEIAYRKGWMDKQRLLQSANRYGPSPYGQHLKNVADGKIHY